MTLTRSTAGMAWFVTLLAIGCEPSAHNTRNLDATSSLTATPKPATSTPASPPTDKHAATPREAPVPLALDNYPWHGDPSIEPVDAVEPLRQRFATPPGYTRIPLADDSMGAWLRDIPLAAAGTPVRSYTGELHLPADHRSIAAVTTLDIGKRDLQQCADAVMRLHAEWLWHRGIPEQASYPSGGGPIPWKRYVAGGYPALSGNTFVWKSRGPRKNDHATYRKYLDAVFSWANTVALEQKTEHVARDAIAPGDFFVLGGSPGHSVLVLDIAKNAEGQRVALLGQSFMPAQSFQVLRPTRDQAWFDLEHPDGVQTPFWRRFPWSSARRLPRP